MLELPGRSAGRKEREMKILKQLYRNGSAYARDLKSTGIPESTIYKILQDLKNAGVVIGEKTRDRASIIEAGHIKDYKLDHPGGSVRIYGGPIPELCSLAGKYVESVRKYCIKN